MVVETTVPVWRRGEKASDEETGTPALPPKREQAARRGEYQVSERITHGDHPTIVMAGFDPPIRARSTSP